MGGGSLPLVLLVLVLPPAVEPYLLPWFGDQVADKATEHGAGKHHPDQPGMAGDEDEVHWDGLRVRDDEQDQDDHDCQDDQNLSHAGLPGPLDFVHVLLIGLAIRVCLAGARDALPPVGWNVGFTAHRPSSNVVDTRACRCWPTRCTGWSGPTSL
jgi:hypothetical protein